MQSTTTKVAELVFDYDLYPRSQVDSSHVTQMMEAVKAGVELPPVIADKKTGCVTDGWHRCRRATRADGPDATIEVIFRPYKSRAEMLLDAIRLNASHGRHFSPYDRTRAILLAQDLGIDEKALAGALAITTERIGELRVSKSATVKTGKVTTSVPIKRTIGHMAGKRLSRAQQAANEKLGGMGQLFYVNQLITLIETDLVNVDDENLLEGLRKLHGLLETHLTSV